MLYNNHVIQTCLHKQCFDMPCMRTCEKRNAKAVAQWFGKVLSAAYQLSPFSLSLTHLSLLPCLSATRAADESS